MIIRREGGGLDRGLGPSVVCAQLCALGGGRRQDATSDKYTSTRSDVQVATPHPKKSVSSVQIGHRKASAVARIGQSSSSRRARRCRAIASKPEYASSSTVWTTLASESKYAKKGSSRSFRRSIT